MLNRLRAICPNCGLKLNSAVVCRIGLSDPIVRVLPRVGCPHCGIPLRMRRMAMWARAAVVGPSTLGVLMAPWTVAVPTIHTVSTVWGATAVAAVLAGCLAKFYCPVEAQPRSAAP